MKYRDYDIANFITDEFFIQWVKNPDENNQHFWEKWISEHPEKRTLVSEAANLIRSVKYANSPEFTDKMYIETFEQILRADHSRQVRQTNAQIMTSAKKKDFYSVFPIRGIAASLLVLFCIWGQHEAVKFSPEPVEIPEIPMVTRSNPAGQKSIIDLPDGTKIHLNSESEIKFPKDFSDDIRMVSLKGEAFFEVEKEHRPFLVQSGNTKIYVLGTSFNVNQRGNGSLYVALMTGKVSVNTENGNQMTLDPNEMLEMKKGGVFRKTGFDPMGITGWKDNYLVFKSAKLPYVKKKLETWYGVKIIFEGDFDDNWTYSGIYKDEMLENVLRGICMTSGMIYKIKNKQITITNPK
ncbi:FecR family protein [Aquiflexum sp.]|uniref:FecR family protein n=1 Tax=Aquiflexum sp. TaxID=1872584 RepID=UPI003593FE16